MSQLSSSPARRTVRRRLLSVWCAAMALLATALLVPATAHAAAGDPFPQGSGLVFVAQGSPTTRLFTAAQTADGSVAFSPEGPNSGIRYNAIGFNEADRYLYGVRQPNDNRLVRIGQEGAVTNLGAVSGLPVNDYNQGTFGEGATATTLYVRDSAPNNQLYAINVNTRTATRITLSAQVPNVADLVWVDGFIWALHGEGQRMYRINPTTGAVSSWSTVPLRIPADQHGAQWVYGNGNIGLSDNVTGQVTQLRITNPTAATPTFTVISRIPGPGSANNDGASTRGESTDLSILKSTDPVFTPGSPLTYTLTVTNNGPGASSGWVIDDELPAELVDLSTTTPGCTIVERTLNCVGGPLAVDASFAIEVTGSTAATQTECISNTATVLGNEADPNGGDNSSTASTCPPPPVDLSLVKSSTPTFVPGQPVEFTLTITNNSANDSSGYTVTDEISSQLTGLSSTTAGCSFTGNTLTCTGGPLAAGATTVVNVTGTTSASETTCVQNSAIVVGNEPDPDDANNSGSTASCPVVSGRAFAVTKAASAQTLNPGDTMTYTITVINTGDTAFTALDPASFTDDLTDVLDDAVYNGDATAGATFDTPTLSWSGALDIGGTVSVTYSVTVLNPTTGDLHLINGVVPGTDGSCLPADSCTTDVPISGFVVSKTASPTSTTRGGVVEYTITVTNTGAVAYTDAAPASLADDLAGVLDDATYNGDVTGGATIDGSVLQWAGPLGIGASVQITYSVTVNDAIVGDLHLRNVVAPGGGGLCDPAATCETNTPVSAYTVTKAASSATTTPGGIVTYTITVQNIGQVDYSDVSPASFTDDLSSVLDDASYNGDASNGAIVTDSTLSWSGPLAVGAISTVTYSVTVGDPPAGDMTLRNAVVPGPDGRCSSTTECDTETPVALFTVEKSVDADTAAPGTVLTYRITVRNTGAVAYDTSSPATFSDDLTDILDDATYNDDASGGAVFDGAILTWSGPLDIGATLTVTYTATVNDPLTGDRTLANTVVPGEGGECAEEGGCTTTTPLAGFIVSKTASAQQVDPGQTVRYTVVVTNIGETAYTEEDPASFTDDLTAVLDDAVYNDDATSDAVVAGGTLNWSGALPVGESVTVTYSFTVKNPDSGDRTLLNVVVPGEGGACDRDARCTTETLVPPPSWLAQTGAAIAPVLPYGIGALLIGGLVMLLGRRRTERAEEI
ncbi:DUF6923 family protein [Microbacterium oxydans]|uniref:DUF7927 domain-containing protein n=1 Tax=Microbacterium oxydans TaxID=82380 RepID=UPI0024ADB00F|nr:hypothetical protein [Microbacterium oxydans]